MSNTAPNIKTKHNFFECKKFLYNALAMAVVFLTVSCSDKESDLQSPSSVFRIGNIVLFETGANSELLPSAPRIESNSESVLPKLTYSVENRIAASIGNADTQVTPRSQASTYKNSSKCSLNDTLLRSASILSRVAKQKNSYTRVDKAFASISDCESKEALECFLKDINSVSWSDVTTATERGITLKSIVAKLGQCTGSESPWVTQNHFELVGLDARFFPDVVSAIYIFEGAPQSYTYAVDNLNSVAKLSNIMCEENCFVSPQPISALTACAACKPFVAGNSYTAFLKIGIGSRDQDFVRITFVAP